jgi:hypothetical protein
LCKLELDFWLVIELGYLSVALPKLNVVAVYKLLRLFLGLCVIGAVQVNRTVKMAIRSDDINAIIRHGAAPLLGGSATLSVTDGCLD